MGHFLREIRLLTFNYYMNNYIYTRATTYSCHAGPHIIIYTTSLCVVAVLFPSSGISGTTCSACASNSFFPATFSKILFSKISSLLNLSGPKNVTIINAVYTHPIKMATHQLTSLFGMYTHDFAVVVAFGAAWTGGKGEFFA
jgi:hypothetical protein